MKAFQRLQMEIINQSNDQSLFAWSHQPSDGIQSANTRLTGPLATSPSQFMNAGNIFSYHTENEEPYSMTNKGLRIRLPMMKALPKNDFLYIAPLSCYCTTELTGLVLLLLVHLQGNEFARVDYPLSTKYDLQFPMTWESKLVFVKESSFKRIRVGLSRSIQIKLAQEGFASTANERVLRRGVRLIAVTPPRFWDGSKVTLLEVPELEQTAALYFERNGKVLIISIRLDYARDHVKWEVRIDIIPGDDMLNAHIPPTTQDFIFGTFQITPLIVSEEGGLPNLILNTTSDSVLRKRLYDDTTYPLNEEVIISFGAVVGSNVANLKVDVIQASATLDQGISRE
ncbi:hypothetical protein V8E51_016301 [Hyaloscypha variabilis]